MTQKRKLPTGDFIPTEGRLQPDGCRSRIPTVLNLFFYSYRFYLHLLWLILAIRCACRLDRGGGGVRSLRRRRDLCCQWAKCWSIVEVIFGSMFFVSMNIYLMLLNLDDIVLLQVVSLCLTILLMFHQTTVKGFFFEEDKFDDVKLLLYNALNVCFQILIASVAIYISSDNFDHFSRKNFNPYFLTFIHMFFYFSLQRVSYSRT